MSEVFQFWIALALKVKDSCKDEAHNARDSSDNAYRRGAGEKAEPRLLADAPQPPALAAAIQKRQPLDAFALGRESSLRQILLFLEQLTGMGPGEGPVGCEILLPLAGSAWSEDRTIRRLRSDGRH